MKKNQMTKKVWATIRPNGRRWWLLDCSTERANVEDAIEEGDKFVRATLTVDLPAPKKEKVKR